MSLKIKTNNQKSYIDKKEYSYQPVIYQAPTDMDFHYYDEEGNLQIKAKCTLIRSLDELKEYAIKCTGKPVGFDTETTGLTFGEDKIVGFSLALNGLEGVYIPIGPIQALLRQIVYVSSSIGNDDAVESEVAMLAESIKMAVIIVATT